jgi:cytochrome P450
MKYQINDRFVLQVYMREMIKDRLASDVRDKHDLFSSLIHANKEGMEGVNLTEEELMGLCALVALFHLKALKELVGNIFVFLVAGHEVCYPWNSRSRI